MSKFPLYDSLSKNNLKTDLTLNQKRLFVKRISSLDNEGHNLIYALIRIYQIENNKEETNISLPYKGEVLDTDILFDVDNLPINLKRILLKFVSVHMEKIAEEKSRT
jgi:hypothetical protein